MAEVKCPKCGSRDVITNVFGTELSGCKNCKHVW
jgi:Zn-finger nucleic acid-binding protein